MDPFQGQPGPQGRTPRLSSLPGVTFLLPKDSGGANPTPQRSGAPGGLRPSCPQPIDPLTGDQLHRLPRRRLTKAPMRPSVRGPAPPSVPEASPLPAAWLGRESPASRCSSPLTPPPSQPTCRPPAASSLRGAPTFSPPQTASAPQDWLPHWSAGPASRGLGHCCPLPGPGRPWWEQPGSFGQAQAWLFSSPRQPSLVAGFPKADRAWGSLQHEGRAAGWGGLLACPAPPYLGVRGQCWPHTVDLLSWGHSRGPLSKQAQACGSRPPQPAREPLEPQCHLSFVICPPGTALRLLASPSCPLCAMSPWFLENSPRASA